MFVVCPILHDCVLSGRGRRRRRRRREREREIELT
jgi:hypothetical protein